jgi:hypothetical protein
LAAPSVGKRGRKWADQ